MKFKIIIIVLIVSLALNVGFASMVLFRHSATKRMFRKGPEIGMMKGPMMHPFFKKFGITKEQELQLVKLQEETQKAVAPISKEMREQRGKLFKMVKEGKIDDAQKKEIIAKLAGFQIQMDEIIVDSMIKSRTILTAEQLEKMDKILGKFDENFIRPCPSDSGPMMHRQNQKGGLHKNGPADRTYNPGK